jgi:hypothetical protein
MLTGLYVYRTMLHSITEQMPSLVERGSTIDCTHYPPGPPTHKKANMINVMKMISYHLSHKRHLSLSVCCATNIRIVR